MPADKAPTVPDTSINPRAPVSVQETIPASQPPQSKSLRFWAVFFSLCLLGLSTSLEATIVTTALPTIIESLDLGKIFVWVGNAFLLASTIFQPLVGQLADIFGRKWPLVCSVVLFVLGSGIAGGATNAGMLIGGRTVQGLGAGAILVLIDVIVSDLLPLQERAKFLGLVRITGAIGSSIGPIVGGAIAEANWRWCFYLNLVTGGLAFIALLAFLDLHHHPEPTWKAALARIDYVGSALFVASITSLILGLILGGTVFPWNSANIIVPIVLGAVGWASFHFYESTKFCRDAVVPGRLFGNSTSFAGFLMALDGALLLYWVIWYLPVYFQGVLGASPLRSGVDQLPLNMFLVPAGIFAGGFISKSGKYKATHFVGFGLSAIGIGLFTLLRPSSGKQAWACFEIITALGLGIILTAILPAIQASLPTKDIAKSTALYAFARSFGGVWGVTIPSIIFTNQINKFLKDVDDPSVRADLGNGAAYQLATKGFIQTLPEPTQSQVLHVYTEALKTVWQVGIGFALLGFLAAFAVKQYDMTRKDQGDFGLKKEGIIENSNENSNIERGVEKETDKEEQTTTGE